MARTRAPLLALACAAVVAVAAACDSDGGGDTSAGSGATGRDAGGYVCGDGPVATPAPAAAPAAVDDYAEALAVASGAMAMLPPPPTEFVDSSGVTAVVSLDTAAVAEELQEAIAEWQAALQGAAAADLDGTGLADGRAALLASSPVLVQEWTRVAQGYAAGGRVPLGDATPASVEAADALCAAADQAEAAAEGRATDTLDAARARVEETVDALREGG